MLNIANMICSSTVYVLLVCENQHTLCRFNTQPKPKLHTFFRCRKSCKIVGWVPCQASESDQARSKYRDKHDSGNDYEI